MTEHPTDYLIDPNRHIRQLRSRVRQLDSKVKAQEKALQQIYKEAGDAYRQQDGGVKMDVTVQLYNIMEAAQIALEYYEAE